MARVVTMKRATPKRVEASTGLGSMFRICWRRLGPPALLVRTWSGNRSSPLSEATSTMRAKVRDQAGVSYWSWPVIQVVCALVIWAWSRTFARMVEVASLKGLDRLPDQVRASKAGGPSLRQQMRDMDPRPVLASTRFGVALFIVTTLAMFGVLLIFAFWGLFIYQ